MSRILHIDSSPRTADSVTRQLSQSAIKAVVARHPQSTVTYRDLAEKPAPFLTGADLGTMFTPADKRTADQAALWQGIESTVDEFIAADIYVFGVPMYNFSVPAAFKAYIDRIVVVGKTFSYEGGRPKGLLHSKKAYILVSSGGNYDDPAMSHLNFHEPYLRTIFGFIGITDITFFKVHGHSPDEIAKGLAEAKQQIEQTIAEKTASGV
jgi:FMN-dependent NADH-azoreductase